ncbi:MAG: efflux RND transporter permease subunit [Calditrichaeota bacterium]|nr:efflux RND transporter permease subunit [Calditrichota bacterium]
MANIAKDNIEKIRNSFYTFTTTRPVAILMVVIGVTVFGIISYQQLPLNLMPEMTYPSLTVRTEYPGTAPEEIETSISRPIEQALGVVDNLVSISSISKAEQSDVILDFTWDTDMDKATADLREKLDQVFLPEDSKRPLILRFDPSLDPIMRVGLYGDAGLTYLRYIAEEELKRALETVDGVAAVKVKGGLEEEIRVELDEQQLTLIGMDIQSVKNRLAEENVNLAGGNLKEGQTEYLVRTLNEFKNTKEIENLVIGQFNGVKIRVKDVGNVYRTSKEREIITRIKGTESVEIEIYKEADANIVAVARSVKDKLYGTEAQQAFVSGLKEAEKQAEQKKKEQAEKKDADKKTDVKKAANSGGAGQGGPGNAILKAQMTNFLAYTLPEGVNIETLSDQSVFIENSVNEVKNTAIQGGFLAIIVLFIFLRRMAPTIIIALAIPISIVATFAPMKIFDVTLNIMSLGGLALGIGMLVDNSIVVLESIARCRDEGDDLITSTLRGVKEVGGAVIASTLTTIAVFFPIVFVEGVAGQVFGDMALTVVFSLLASLAVALFLIPMLASRQTSAFVRDAQVSRIPKDYILDLKVRTEIDSLFVMGNDKTFMNRVSQWFVLFAKAAWVWVTKTVQMFAAFIIAIFKAFIVFGMTLFTPIGFFIRFIKKEKRYSIIVREFAEKNNWGFLKLSDNIWENYATIKSAGNMYDDFINYFKKYKTRTLFKNIIAAIFLLVAVVFLFGKYLVAVLFEFVFRFFHAAFMILSLFGTFVYMIVRLLFTPFTNLLVSVFNWGYGAIENWYPVLLKKSLESRYTIIGLVMVLFLFTVYVLAPRLGSELIPEVHQGEFYVELTLPVGTPVEETDQRVGVIENDISALDGVFKVASVSGTDKSAASDSEEGEHTSKLTVTVNPSSNLEKTEEDVIEKIRGIIGNYSGVTANISRPTLFSFKTPIEVHIKGYNLTKLQDYSQEMEERISKIPGIVDAKSNLQRGNPEVQIYYDRTRISHYGMNVLEVASIVRNKIRGDVATEFKEEDRKIDILVRLRESDKESIDDLRRLVINPNSDRPIRLASVADIRINEGPSEIRRVGQQRTAVITANIMPGYDLKNLNDKIFNEILKLNLPNDFTYELAGQNKEMETSLNSLLMALGLAIFLVYIVMASQFESLIHPFVIIFTIPLALIGVIIFLYILNIPLSIVVFLGLIMLAGIVVNNAIVLVDYINHLRTLGMDKITAIIEAGKARLRPILMTTSTTVLGLLPMALGFGDGAEIRTPMAITVIVGLLSSTLLTLVVIPTVYSIVGREKSETENPA